MKITLGLALAGSLVAGATSAAAQDVNAATRAFSNCAVYSALRLYRPGSDQAEVSRQVLLACEGPYRQWMAAEGGANDASVRGGLEMGAAMVVGFAVKAAAARATR